MLVLKWAIQGFKAYRNTMYVTTCCDCSWILLHPGRLTWNQKNHPIEKENHLTNYKPLFSGSMLIFQGVFWLFSFFWLHGTPSRDWCVYPNQYLTLHSFGQAFTHRNLFCSVGQTACTHKKFSHSFGQTTCTQKSGLIFGQTTSTHINLLHIVGQSTYTQINLLHIAGQPGFPLPAFSGTRKSRRINITPRCQGAGREDHVLF